MRRVVCWFTVALTIVCFTAHAQFARDSDEITLYSATGKPIAYIADDDDSTIYLWSGNPAAYLRSEDVYGFNGKHPGWFVKGLIYDHDGEIVGAVRSKLKGPVHKPGQINQANQADKSIREIKPIRPILGLTWSEDETLRPFLLAGADD
jgi:4-fold beta flower protein